MTDMKKLLILVFAALCFTACGNDDEPEATPTITKEIREVWSSLSGTYSTTFYVLNTDNVWYTETITFKPYSAPEKFVPIMTDKRGDIYAYGTADIQDTRFTSITGTSHCYYCLGYSSTGKLTITFYQYANDSGESWGREDERSIRLLSASEFEMWSYGTSEAENVHKYVRQ